MAFKEGNYHDTLPAQQYLWDGAKPVKAKGTTDGEVVVRNITADIDWDAITPTYNSTSDVYVFSKSAVTTATITVSYQDSTKAVLTGVTKVLS
jgi:hypothetical protein